MNEGVSPAEVGAQLAEHARHTKGDEDPLDDRRFSFIEALLLSVVAVLAAYAGYSSAKWSTESRLDLAAASSAHTAASRANLESITTRNFDASTFNTWFAAYVAKSPAAMDVAVRRFRPEFKVAFDAWIATDPTTNPHAPSGPTYMSEYKELTA